MKEYSNSLALKQFDDEQPLTLMYCTAAWCGPCKQLAPVMEQVSELHQKQVNTVKVDVDSYPEVAAKLGVRGVPSLVLMNKADIVDRLVGLSSIDDINEWISGHSQKH